MRKDILGMIYAAESGHPGGSLSAVDLLVHVFDRELRALDTQPEELARDRFILSKGHAAPALYAVAAAYGWLDRRQLGGLRKLGNPLQGHPDVRMTPFVEASTGSLGQGFSTGLGLALGLRHQRSPARVLVLLGDGELQEGQVWESAMMAAHHRLSNLCVIVDYNKMQSDDLNENVVGLEPLAERWRAFGWHVIEIDGHDFERIEGAFDGARSEKSAPTVIIAHTVKGQGVSYMASSPLWHGSVKLSDSDLVRGFEDLGGSEHEAREVQDGSYFHAS